MPKILKNVNIRNFMLEKYVLQHKIPYICIVFFMVLDLRLTEIDCRETINFFLSLSLGREWRGGEG